MDVQIIGNGSNANIEAQVDPTGLALRTSVRPWEYSPQNSAIGGHYSVGMISGTIAAGIASLAQVFQARWADSVKLMALKKVIIQCSTATGFAATSQGCPLELIVGHGSTANGSGGTPLAPNNISNRMRASMAPTAFLNSGEIRIATTAALGAATGQVLEAGAVSGCMGADNRTLVSTPQMTLFDQRDTGDHPLILYSGDTLVLRTNSPAATGTWLFYVWMDWAELISF